MWIVQCLLILEWSVDSFPLGKTCPKIHSRWKETVLFLLTLCCKIFVYKSHFLCRLHDSCNYCNVIWSYVTDHCINCPEFVAQELRNIWQSIPVSSSTDIAQFMAFWALEIFNPLIHFHTNVVYFKGDSMLKDGQMIDFKSRPFIKKNKYSRLDQQWILKVKGFSRFNSGHEFMSNFRTR